MGRGVFRIGIARVGHGGVEGRWPRPSQEIRDSLPCHGHACRCAALPMMRDDSVQPDNVALLYALPMMRGDSQLIGDDVWLIETSNSFIV